MKFNWFKSLFPHGGWATIGLFAFVLALVLAFASRCRASDLTMEAGYQYLRGPAAAVTVNIVLDGPRDTDVEAGLFLVGETPDHLGVMGAQALVVDGFGRFDIGIGLAYMNRDDYELLGSQMNFALMARYRVTERFYLTVRHWSNAGTTEENTGLDLILVGYRF